MTSALDSYGQCALMAGTGAGSSSGEDLTSLGNILAKSGNILVVDALDFVNTE